MVKLAEEQSFMVEFPADKCYLLPSDDQKY